MHSAQVTLTRQPSQTLLFHWRIMNERVLRMKKKLLHNDSSMAKPTHLKRCEALIFFFDVHWESDRCMLCKQPTHAVRAFPPHRYTRARNVFKIESNVLGRRLSRRDDGDSLHIGGIRSKRRYVQWARENAWVELASRAHTSNRLEKEIST